ncbi:hypothetical protein CDCA_CDCA01G0097 [Cyanidium caldarium]|uniref:Nucleoid-associated protein n=1 Tax=Cyanidium caldarium TaxID=2771 RepID=A0AAV9INZ4_CYACA|nr:hypothetical protein CDCA_CDCA01G0097 [Cyanidium caldarium]|eukprot:ctg_1147.g230
MSSLSFVHALVRVPGYRQRATLPFRRTCTAAAPGGRLRLRAASDEGGEAGKNDKKQGGGGLFGGLGNLMDAMKKAQEFSKSAQALQEELKSIELEATSADGRVRVVITGQQVPVRVEIADDLIAEGNPAVSDAVTEAVKEAHKLSAERMKTQLGQLTQNFGLPQQPNQ